MRSIGFLLLSIGMLSEFVQSLRGVPGGWSHCSHLGTVQTYINEIREDIIATMRNNPDFNDLRSDCDSVHAISAEQQVVAGMNYRANIEVCNLETTVKFYVPLGVNTTPTSIVVPYPF